MKRKFKHASKSMLSVILAIMMALSTMFVGIVSVDAANNGDNLYVYYGAESQFTTVSSKSMTYSSNLYTTVIDFTDAVGWTWYLLSISSSDSDRKVCWNDQPTIICNTDKIKNFQPGSLGEYTNLVKFETNGNAPAGTSDLVKVTYDITANTITFAPGDSEPPTEPTTEPTTTSPTDPNVRVWFKSASASAYVPSVSLDGDPFLQMTRIRLGENNSTYFGSTYSGSLKFYWYYADLEDVDSSITHTLTFKTAGTSVKATSGKNNLNSGEYFFAVDNLMDDDTLVTLPSGDEYEYIRNYHRSATHMVYNELVDGSSSLGFTYIDGAEHPMGQILSENDNSQNDIQTAALNSRLIKFDFPSIASVGAGDAAFTIDSATLTQKYIAALENVSELQRCLLDVTLDGEVDIRDVTLMQKALAQ